MLCQTIQVVLHLILTYKNWDLAIGIDFQDGGLYHSVTDMFSMAAGLHDMDCWY